MRKLILLLGMIMVVSMTGICFGQTKQYFDFECINPEFFAIEGAVIDRVNNPGPSGINTSKY